MSCPPQRRDQPALGSPRFLFTRVRGVGPVVTKGRTDGAQHGTGMTIQWTHLVVAKL